MFHSRNLKNGKEFIKTCCHPARYGTVEMAITSDPPTGGWHGSGSKHPVNVIIFKERN